MTTTLNLKTSQLAQDFINGLLHPKELTLEDSMVFDDADLESIVSRYCHGDCHNWTYALKEEQPILEVHYILLGSEVIHSFVTDASGKLALDANGVHHYDQVKRYWSMITTEVCSAVKMNEHRISLNELINDEPDDLEDAHANIALWYEKTEQHLKAQEV